MFISSIMRKIFLVIKTNIPLRQWEQTNLVLNLMETVKPGFLLSLLCVSCIKRNKILISQISPLKFRYFTDQNKPKEGSHENEFWKFSNTKMNNTLRAENVDEKNVVIGLVSFFPSWVKIAQNSAFFANLCWSQQEI